jgi:hypothetical protein
VIYSWSTFQVVLRNVNAFEVRRKDPRPEESSVPHLRGFQSTFLILRKQQPITTSLLFCTDSHANHNLPIQYRTTSLRPLQASVRSVLDEEHILSKLSRTNSRATGTRHFSTTTPRHQSPIRCLTMSDGFVRDAIDAWAQHQHLVICPDDV